MATVIIPAHNEAEVIADCLDSIVHQRGVDRIIVACNGCTDSTVEIVQSRYPSVHCLDLPKPSKVNALNEADNKARELGVVYPVFYIDADTTLGEGAIESITKTLEDSEDVLLAAPTPRIDLTRSSWLVKQYYRVWRSLPYVQQGAYGAGGYALTREGRERFERFADVISDDGFVRHHFWFREISSVPEAEIALQAPTNFRSLIKIGTRSRLGNVELRKKGLIKIAEQKKQPRVLLQRLFSKQCLSTLIYVGTVLLIKTRARFQSKRLENYTWERDLTSRRGSEVCLAEKSSAT